MMGILMSNKIKSGNKAGSRFCSSTNWSIANLPFKQEDIEVLSKAFLISLIEIKLFRISPKS